MTLDVHAIRDQHGGQKRDAQIYVVDQRRYLDGEERETSDLDAREGYIRGLDDRVGGTAELRDREGDLRSGWPGGINQ